MGSYGYRMVIDTATGDKVYEELYDFPRGMDSVYAEPGRVVEVGDGLFFVPVDGDVDAAGVTLETIRPRGQWVITRVAELRP